MGEIITPMPRRKIIAIPTVLKKEYSYSRIIEEQIPEEQIAIITIGKNDLSYNMDKLRELLKNHNDIRIKFNDFDSVLFIDSILNEKVENDCILMDDGNRISREYIDLTLLKNINLIVPLTYLMWGVKFNNEVKTYCFNFRNDSAGYINPASANGNEKLSREDLEKILAKAKELSSLSKTDKSYDNMMLVSDFIQSHTQFISGDYSTATRGTFYAPGFPKSEKYRDSGYVETVLNKNHGVCMGISNLGTMLLNNPEFNTEVESVMSHSHVWNRVLIDGKYYYFDNTWNITRTEDPHEDGLITLSFSNKYMLFGKKTADTIGNHNPITVPIYNNGVLSEEDFINIQKYQSKLEYPKEPYYESYER